MTTTKCNGDCFNCPYPDDCKNDDISDEELEHIENMDKCITRNGNILTEKQQKSKQRANESVRRWQLNNKERMRKKQHEWYVEHRESALERDRKNYYKRKERQKACEANV